MVHLAPMGYVYSSILSPLGQKIAQGPFKKPTVTICGIHLPPDVVSKHSTVLPHDHPEGCAECLRGLSSQPTDKVQPVLL